jgi:maltokinase
VRDTVAGVVLEDMLAQWLPQQRWFPGRGTTVGELTVNSDITLLDGDPQLRHLVVEVTQPSGPARFQVLLGGRGELPPELDLAVIGRVPGQAVYDALHDPQLAAVLLRGIAEQRQEGPLRFVREAAAPQRDWPLADWPPARQLTAEQSNTSLIFGDAAILKVLRRLFPGANPDLEVADALARLGSAAVAAPFGWIETMADGEPVLLAVLSEFLAGASDGWTLALESRREGTAFAAQARELGLATARVHADMATAFGTRDMTRAELAGLAGTLRAKLTEAVAVLPDLGAHAARIAGAYDDLAGSSQPVRLQRIHGDYHLGQVMRSHHGWVALDFEGEPAAPLAERRALAPATRDVAGMLRSFDYAARHQLVGLPRRPELAAAAGAWVTQCQDAFCAGYAAGGGADPRDQAALLRALTLEKAVYEVIYEYRHRPGWLSIPLDYVAAA